MLARNSLFGFVLSLLTFAGFACVRAEDLQSKPSDNSGRQIAVVAPAMAHPVTTLPVSPATTPMAIPARKPVSADPLFGSVGRTRHGTPIPVTGSLPSQAQDAVHKGIRAINAVGQIAGKRIADCITWMSLLFKDLNNSPKITPVSSSLIPFATVAPMGPISDPGKRAQLFFTSEHRLRTVVGR